MNLIKYVKVKNFGDSIKDIFCLEDDSIVEMAIFIHKEQLHFCVSTQVGCPIGCRHCATTYSSVKYRRNLNTNELIEMINYALAQKLFSGQKILSFSGHGEPALNWSNILSVKSVLKNEFDRIYITTIGQRDVLYQILYEEKTDITYYLSLHGSTDEERALLIPNSKKYSTIDELFEFTRKYSNNGGKIVLNYMLHKNNSSTKSLDQLYQLLGGCNKNVSLRFTDFNSIGYKTKVLVLTEEERRRAYSYIEFKKEIFEEWTCRYSKLEGEGMQIACGQLRASIMGKDGI